jgi:hypothetical protein
MRAAAYAFRNNLVKPAPNPTTFIYGRRSLYDPASMDYAGSYGRVGLSMLPTTYQYGVRLLIDPTREDDEVKGPMVSVLDSARHTIIKPNEQITFDTQRGGLSFDAPGIVAFAGFMSKFGSSLNFRNGVVLRDVQIAVPATMPYKEGIADEKYIAFALVSKDGLPLEMTKHATLSLTSTSFNTGFKFGHDDPRNPTSTQSGTAPVLVARVGATIEAPALRGMRYTLRDWHMREIGRGTVSATLRIPKNLPVFVIEFQRP